MYDTNTLISAAFDAPRVAGGYVGPGVLADDDIAAPLPPQREFQIQSADAFTVRQSANVLLQERYGWRGYQSVSLPADQTADRITLTAREKSTTIGTITVGLDGALPLNCEQVFPDEIKALRAEYGRICEFTKLAVDPVAGTKRVLAGLFHVAYIVAHRMRSYSAVVMEVNPRHVRFYERMLGGRVFGGERLNTSVNAPAVLLVIDFAFVAAQIKLRAGRAAAADDRSFYSLAFNEREEHGIVNRLMTVQKPVSSVIN